LFNSCVNDAVIIKYGSQIVCTGDKDIVKICDYDFEKLKFRVEKKFSDQKSYRILETSYDGQYISFRKANCRYGEVAVLDTEDRTLIENLAGFGDFIYGRNPVPPIGRTMFCQLERTSKHCLIACNEKSRRVVPAGFPFIKLISRALIENGGLRIENDCLPLQYRK
jgi:hypothetical protein